jgi:cytidylate kinase
MDQKTSYLVIGVVGPCGSGKSTLVKNLAKYHLILKHIGQEHSYVADMWQRLAKPNLLIFLDASYPVTVQRRQLDWTVNDYQEQHYRLRHARQHADFYLNTDALTPQEVTERVLHFLGFEPGGLQT